MGDSDTTDDAVAARRAFVRQLRTHEDVLTVNFSRDGYRLVVIGLKSNTKFRDEWRRTATRLGYTVEQLGADASRPAWPEGAWILRLAEIEDATDRSTWRTRVRRTGTRLVRALRDRLKE